VVFGGLQTAVKWSWGVESTDKLRKPVNAHSVLVAQECGCRGTASLESGEREGEGESGGGARAIVAALQEHTRSRCCNTPEKKSRGCPG
jgi:hypothetical protein